jgi:hypothetical protein
MLQFGNDAGLALEPGRKSLILAMGGVDDLKGYVPIQGRVIGLENRAHAALANFFKELIRTNIFADFPRHHDL